MDQATKLTIVACGLALAALALVVGVRRPADRSGPGSSSRATRTPTRTSRPTEDRRGTEGSTNSFRRAMTKSHAMFLAEMLKAEDYWGADYCGPSRWELRGALARYAEVRATDFHLAISQQFMTREEMTRLWGSPDDELALHQANDRLHAGIVTKSDFFEPDARYLKIYVFPDDVKPACAEPMTKAVREEPKRRFDGAPADAEMMRLGAMPPPGIPDAARKRSAARDEANVRQARRSAALGPRASASPLRLQAARNPRATRGSRSGRAYRSDPHRSGPRRRRRRLFRRPWAQSDDPRHRARRRLSGVAVERAIPRDPLGSTSSRWRCSGGRSNPFV